LVRLIATKRGLFRRHFLNQFGNAILGLLIYI
jgi:hypothetical protein